MCIRDSTQLLRDKLSEVLSDSRSLGEAADRLAAEEDVFFSCLLYTSDAADERSSVDLGGRRIIKKKNTTSTGGVCGSRQQAREEKVN